MHLNLWLFQGLGLIMRQSLKGELGTIALGRGGVVVRGKAERTSIVIGKAVKEGMVSLSYPAANTLLIKMSRK